MKQEISSLSMDSPTYVQRSNLSVGRMSSMMDEAFKDMVGVHPYSRQYRESVSVIHACTHALQE